MQRNDKDFDEELFENELAGIIVDCSYHIHVELGQGLFESVYEEIMFHELTSIGLKVEKTKSFAGYLERKDNGYGISNRFDC
ncbi:GxxExxY protein [Aquimarina mytili]|uniref:GxxExxY protein n=1 Tax=Aquimarina mytili TaxID=874423 RepID=UPI00293D691D|nr:GxxExxY protein [Aquimarina mytili]